MSTPARRAGRNALPRRSAPPRGASVRTEARDRPGVDGPSGWRRSGCRCTCSWILAQRSKPRPGGRGRRLVPPWPARREEPPPALCPDDRRRVSSPGYDLIDPDQPIRTGDPDRPTRSDPGADPASTERVALLVRRPGVPHHHRPAPWRSDRRQRMEARINGRVSYPRKEEPVPPDHVGVPSGRATARREVTRSRARSGSVSGCCGVIPRPPRPSRHPSRPSRHPSRPSHRPARPSRHPA